MIVSAHRWPDNAALIAEAVVPLGYIRPEDRLLDLTYGRGKWWTRYHHRGFFVALVDDDDAADSVGGEVAVAYVGKDYRNLSREFDEGEMDVVVFDPPYIAMGGRATSGMGEFMDRYGLENAATTPAKLHADNAAGLAEAHRIVVPGGLVLVKCAPYISSGRRQEGDDWMREAAFDLGMRVVDKFIHVGDVRAQPSTATCRTCRGSGVDDGGGDPPPGLLLPPCPRCKGEPLTRRTQRHARNNYSVLFVFAKQGGRRDRRTRA